MVSDPVFVVLRFQVDSIKEWRMLTYTLAFLHSVVQERRKVDVSSQ